MTKFLVVILTTLCLLKVLQAQVAVNPLAESEALITQLNNKLALESSSAGINIGTTSKTNFKALASMRYASNMQLKALTTASKMTTDPAHQQCVDQANLAATNIQNQILQLQKCGVSDILTGKNFSRQIKLLKTRAKNVMVNCQALYPDQVTQVEEIKQCVSDEVTAIEDELVNLKEAFGGSSGQQGSCIQDNQQSISLALAEAQEEFNNCISPVA